MDFVSLSLIAVGLAMDAFAVSLSCGLSLDRVGSFRFIRVPLTFGIFQAVMPLVGWAVGSRFRALLGGVDHWVAWLLLSGVGVHMLWASWGPAPCPRSHDPLRWHVLLPMGLATSLDALAVGFGFAFLGVRLLSTVLYIGLVTFVISGIGIFLGNRIGLRFQKIGERLGGVLLIGIGTKILIQHLVGGV